MAITAALKWRYATKRMNGTKIPEHKMDVLLDAIALAPSSLGLQPYSVLIVENKELLQKIQPIAENQPQITKASAVLVFAAWDEITQERIQTYIHRIAEERNVTVESLDKTNQLVSGMKNHSVEENFIWSSKQAYIALGIALVAAAEAEVDSTPMEGFNKHLLDELLDLKSRGLQSQVIMALGYRDSSADYLVNLKKVRRAKAQLFIHLK